MMTFPTEWKNNPNVPNHQPEWMRNRATPIFKKSPFNRGCTGVFRRFTNNFVESLWEIMGEKSNGSCPPVMFVGLYPP
jgi:hypothetical protein